MSIDRITLKANAKASIAGAKPSAAMVTFVYLVIVFVIEAIVMRLTAVWDSIAIYELTEGYHVTIEPEIIISGILLIVITIMVNIVGIGYTAYCLGVSRGEAVGYANLFDSFKFVGKIILIGILMFIFVLLWSLLLFIPGIIAAYRYSQAFYIMLDNPDMSALDCIRASKEMMRGHKLELFVLELSFFGWAILCALTFGILYIWYMPYFQVTYANFYKAVAGNRGSQGFGGPQNGDNGNKPQNNLPWEL